MGRRTFRPSWSMVACASLLAHSGCSSADPAVEADAPSAEAVPAPPAIPAPEAQQSVADSLAMESGQPQSESATSFPLRLQWAFQDGDEFRWIYESGMELEAPQNGKTTRMTAQVRMSFDVNVRTLTEPLFRLHYGLARLEVNMDSPDGMSFEYDSDKTYPDVPPPDESAELSDQELLSRIVAAKLSDLTKLEIETNVDATGQIHKLEVVGALAELAELQGLETLLFLIDEQGLNSLHAGGFVRLPDEEIAPGSIWEQSTDVPIQYGVIRFTHAATLAGLEEIQEKRWLRFDTAITSANVEINPILQDRMSVEHSGGSGMLYVDPTSGQLRSYEFRTGLKITMKGTADSESDQSADVTYFSKTMLQRVDPSETAVTPEARGPLDETAREAQE